MIIPFPALRWPVVNVASCARILALAMLSVAVPAALAAVPGKALPRWERGMLDIHHINTGTGNSAFFVLPDGTTLLLDAGAGYREEKVKSRYDAPPRPDATLRPGQWIARYVQRMHPMGAAGELDYVVLTHFHGDHIGGLEPASPRAPAGTYRLTGITDVAEGVRLHTLLDRGWPKYDYPAPSGGALMLNYRAFLKWQVEHRGLRVETFAPGRSDQLVLRGGPRDFPTFEIRNLAANGRVWTGSGTATRSRFPEGAVPSENNCSTALRLSYGAFSYFSGGDMSGVPSTTRGAWDEMESAVAWVCGPVDVALLNHHASPGDVANDFFLSVLQPRIHVVSVYAASQPGPDVLRRLLSERTYPGPRDIFTTNWQWPGRRDHMVKLFGESDTAWLFDRISQIASNQGHVVVRVDPGGAHYRVIVIDDQRAEGVVLSVHGPFTARSVQAP